MLWVAVYSATREDGSIKWGKRPARLGHGGKAIFASKDPDAVYDKGPKKGQPLPKAHFTFDEILAQYEQCPEATGIALAIVDGQGIVAFDADRCVDPNWDDDLVPDRFDADVSEFMSAANCWATITPSGLGVRGFSFMPDMAGNVALFGSGVRSINKDGRELYPSIPGGKYFVTVTTEVVAGYESMGVCPLDVLTGAILKWGGSGSGSGSARDMPPLEDGLTDEELVRCGLAMDGDVDVLDGNRAVGDRTSALFEIAKRMAERKVSPGAILGTFAERFLPMATAADRRNSPDSQVDWLWTYTVDKAVREAEENPLGSEFEAVDAEGDGSDLDRFEKRVSGREFVLERAGDFRAGCLNSSYLIRKVLPLAELGMVFGPSGSGKTFMVLDMAFALSRGLACWRESQYRITRAVPVVYVCAEGSGGFKRRIDAYGVHTGVDVQDMNDLPFWVIADRPDLHRSDADVVGLVRSVGDRARGGLIILDTLAQIAAGADENSSEMGTIVARCQMLAKATGAMVLLVHHSGKDIEKGSRGWSGLKGPLDVEFGVTGDRGSPAKCMEITKSKDDEDGVKFDFHLEIVTLGVDEHLDSITSCVVVHDLGLGATVSPTPRVRSYKPEALLDVVRDLTTEGKFPTEKMIKVRSKTVGVPRDDVGAVLEELVQMGLLDLNQRPAGLRGPKGHGYYSLSGVSDCDENVSDF
jgi:hypothetical protein